MNTILHCQCACKYISVKEMPSYSNYWAAEELFQSDVVVRLTLKESFHKSCNCIAGSRKRATSIDAAGGFLLWIAHIKGPCMPELPQQLDSPELVRVQQAR